MKRIFIPTTSGSDWQQLLAKPERHWKKGASAMTAAASWESAAPSFPPEIAALLHDSKQEELLGLKLLAAFPEWEVPLEGGVTSSHSDILAVGSNAKGLCVIAVEAKVIEDFGPTLKEKRSAASAGQHNRLDFLHSLLGVARFNDSIRYQLLHRTASALLTAREFHAGSAAMLVHSFGQQPTLRGDFDAFCKAIQAVEVSNGVFSVSARVNPRLFLLWCNGDRQFLDVELPSLHNRVVH